MTIADSNGLGIGLIDELMKEAFDPHTGENLGCWNTINTDAQPEISNAENCLFDLKPQSSNSEMIVNFIDMIENGKLELLEKKANVDYALQDRDNYQENILPFMQTDFLIDEIANLQLKPLTNGKVTVDKVVKKFDKDRFSSTMYGLWYIKEFEDCIYEEEEGDIFDYLIL